MHTIQFVDVKTMSNVPNGLTTYRRDFLNIVYPEISKQFRFVESNPDIYLSFHSPEREYDKPVVWINHRNTKIDNLTYPKNRQIAIVHFSPVQKRFAELGIETKFINMSIDTSIIPKTTGEISDRFLYVGSIRSGDNKQEILNSLKKYAEIDVISFGKFNGAGELTHRDVINTMAKYRYGLGIGRVVLEMLAAGLKCFVAGSIYGGPILSNAVLTTQLQFNCAANMNKRVEMFPNDAVDAKQPISIDLDKIDMRKKVADYIAVLNSALYL